MMDTNNGNASTNGIDMKQMAEKMQKMEAELLALKRENASKQSDPSLHTMMQMVWQFGEKFGELKNEINGIGKEMADLKGNIEKKMQENENKQMAMNEAIEGIKNDIGNIREGIQQFEGINVELANRISRSEANVKSNQMEATKFNAIVVKSLNKWNDQDCGSYLTISENGYVITVRNIVLPKTNSVRAIFPIPLINLKARKPYIAYYFEGQILEGDTIGDTLAIGFCGKQISMENDLLEELNTIVINQKNKIFIDGASHQLGNAADDGYFEDGDFLGIGLLFEPENFSLKCFASHNGKFLGSIVVPEKFMNFELFPAVTMYVPENSIRVNFGNETLRYDPSQLVE